MPLWLSLTGCPLDPTLSSVPVLVDRYADWMARSLCDAYGLRLATARALIRTGRVLPILDGLDELPPGVAGAVIAVLNHDPGAPVILTCRTIDYAELTQDANLPVALDRAQHIAARPLSHGDVAAYLTRALGPDRSSGPWHEVLARLTDNGREGSDATRQLMSNPLRLSLALAAHRDGTLDDITAMLALPADTEIVARALLPKYLHALASVWEGVPDGAQLQAWLTNVARYQHRRDTGNQHDILLPDLWQLATRTLPRWMIELCSEPWTGGRSSTVVRIGDRRQLQDNWRRVLAVGLAFGLLFGLATGRLGGLAIGLATTLAVGLAFGLAFGLAAQPAPTISSAALTRQCRRYTTAVGLATTLTFGLAAGLVFGLTVGLAAGLVLGLVAGNGAVWVRYGLGAAAAARAGVVPHRLSRFLDRGLELGVFRMSGYLVQFRHREIYRALLPEGAPEDFTPSRQTSAWGALQAVPAVRRKAGWVAVRRFLPIFPLGPVLAGFWVLLAVGVWRGWTTLVPAAVSGLAAGMAFVGVAVAMVRLPNRTMLGVEHDGAIAACTARWSPRLQAWLLDAGCAHPRHRGAFRALGRRVCSVADKRWLPLVLHARNRQLAAVYAQWGFEPAPHLGRRWMIREPRPSAPTATTGGGPG